MKQYIKIFLLIFTLILTTIFVTSCSKNNYSKAFETINSNLDILTMKEYNGLLYLGTNDGLYTMDKDEKIKKVDLIKPLSLIHAIYITKNNMLFIGGMNGLISIDSNNKQIYYNDSENWIPDIRILSIYEDNDENLYIGTFNGLGILNQKTKNSKVLTSKNGLLVSMVNLITKTNDNSLWLASYNTRSGGITRIKDNKFYKYTNELASINITCYLKEKNKIYFGGGIYTSGGMTEFEYKNNNWNIIKLWSKKDGLAAEKVRSIFKENNTFYIGSEYDGLSILNKDSHTIYTKNNGLPSNEIKSIIKYNKTLYFGTKMGLAKLIVKNIH